MFLTDDLSESRTIEIRRDLQREGVDVDELESALISHQTLHRHFTDCLDASKDGSIGPTEKLDTARDTVFSLQERTHQVIESTISDLRDAGLIDVGEPEVIINIQVVCENCGRSMDFESTLSDGCDCTTTAGS